jgi:hypothetical protein
MLWTSLDNEPTGHTVVVIGFGSELVNEQLVHFWLVQNSHGDMWGRNGYGRFSSSIRRPNGSLLIAGGVAPIVEPKLLMPFLKIHDAEKADEPSGVLFFYNCSLENSYLILFI